MKKLTLTISAILLAKSAFPCLTCNKPLQNGIYNSLFLPNVMMMLSTFVVLTVIVVILSKMATRRELAYQAAGGETLASVPLTSATVVLGMGVGGFIDGIALHQILQWHEMLSNKLPPDTLMNKSVNMFWDGIFRAFTLITTTVGIWLFWKLLHKPDINKSGYLLSGGMLMGWGLFNLVEGIIDHHILSIHNVREVSPNQTLWNYGFLVFGILLLIAGWLLADKGRKSLERNVDTHRNDTPGEIRS